MSMKMPHSGRAMEQFLLAAKQAEIQALKDLANTCEVVSCVCHLIHQLQRERGLSNIYLGSQGERCHEQRLEQAATAAEAELALREQLQQHYLREKRYEASPRLLSSVAFVLQGLDELVTLRLQVENVNIEAPKVTEAFSRLISGLLSIVFEAADSAGEPAVSRALVAQFNFMQGKEYAGQERAWGANGFASSFFSDDLKERLTNLRIAQQRAFAIFEQFAEPSQRKAWVDIEASENSMELERLRTIIHQITKPEQSASQISEIWYEKATRRIDEMHRLESAMTENLILLSGTQIEKARQSLREHQGKLEALSVTTGAQSPMSMLLDMDAPITALAGSPVSSESRGQGTTPMARSVYDLLREQADHLKRISEDLNEARRVLSERKLVEQAKGLLMKNLGLSEEMAYRKMQDKAMKSNLRLVEVSEIVIQTAKEIAEGKGGE